MVHGVTDIGLSWTTLTWKLQDSYDIYMLDTRGHGLSDPFTHTDDGNTLESSSLRLKTANPSATIAAHATTTRSFRSVLIRS